MSAVQLFHAVHVCTFLGVGGEGLRLKVRVCLQAFVFGFMFRTGKLWSAFLMTSAASSRADASVWRVRDVP